MSTFSITQEDIEHDFFGDAKLAIAGTMDSSYSAPYDDVLEIFNPGQKVWSGSRVILERVALAGATDDADMIKWVIRHAWSCTRLRGVASATISPGATGTLNTLVLHDGHYGPTTVSVYLPTTHVTIASGMAVWAELVWRAAGSRWEVYSADCEDAGA